MKTHRTKLGTFWLVGAMLIAGCATTNYRLRATSAAPAASGTVAVSGGDNGNSHLAIEVDNLAEPSKLTPGASTYVVWVAPVGGDAAQNIGSLQIQGDQRNGSLSAVTPLRNFTVSITPELEARAIAPSGPQVLSVTIHR